MADDDGPGRGRVSGDSLEPARAGHAVCGEPAYLPGHLGRLGGDHVVVVRGEAKQSRVLGGPEADGEHGPQGDGHLAKDLARLALADDSLHTVDGLDRLDLALEHREQRPPVALVGGVLAGREADVGRSPREARLRGSIELCEDGDPTDLLRSDHRASIARPRRRQSSGARPRDGRPALPGALSPGGQAFSFGAAAGRADAPGRFGRTAPALLDFGPRRGVEQSGSSSGS